MKKLNLKIMTKQLADSLAKESAVREKRVEGGIVGRRGKTREKKGK